MMPAWQGAWAAFKETVFFKFEKVNLKMRWALIPLLLLTACAQLKNADLTVAPGVGASAADTQMHTTHAQPRHGLEYQSPLLIAAYNNDLNRLHTLLAKSTEPEPLDVRGRSALHAAASGGALQAAQLLLKHGLPVDARDKAGATPLMYAVNQKRPALTALLLQHGADANAGISDQDGTTPLDFALMRREYTSMRALLAAGARPDAAKQSPFVLGLVDWKIAYGSASLHGETLPLSEPDELDILATLSHRTDWLKLVNARASHNETALMVATEGAPISIVQFLLDHGANPSLRDNLNLIASDWALMAKRHDVYCLINSRQNKKAKSGLTHGGRPLNAASLPRCPSR